MSVSVRIEGEAFSDVRYDVLATACGLADADHARGKMAKLWRQCTAQKAYALPIAVVVSVLGPNAVSGLVESSLGEVVEAGIRIRGTRGRIEWLAKLRKNATKGGKAKAAKRQPIGNPEGNPDACQEPAKTLPPPCPPSPSPSLIQREEEREPGEPGVLALPEPVPQTPTKLSKHEQLAAELAATACAEINRLKHTNFRPDSKGTRKLCKALAKALHTSAEVRAVIQSKRSWIGDAKMDGHFEPPTLLALENFERYLEAIAAKPTFGAAVRIASSTADDEPYLGEPLPQIPAQPEAL